MRLITRLTSPFLVLGLAVWAGACTEKQEAGNSSTVIDQSQASSESSDPTVLASHLGDAFRLIQNGQPDRARLHLQRLLLEDEDDGQALFLFGLSFHVQHRYSQARTHFEGAGQLVPEYPPLHYFYGWCLYNLGEYDGAQAAFEKHLSMQPQSPDSHFAMGLIALNGNDLTQAREQFTQTITMYGEDPQRKAERGRAHSKLGETYARLGGEGNLQLARQHLTTGTELYPDDHESLYQLYRVLLSLGEMEAAEQARLAHEAARQRADLPGVPAP